MNKNTIPKLHLDAFHEAGHAVTAWAYGIGIISVLLTPRKPGAMKTQMATIATLCDLTHPKCEDAIKMIERYVIVRLAGPVGAAIRIEMHHGARQGSSPQMRLAKRAQSKLCQCLEPDVDFAYSCAVAWLENCDESTPEQALVRLWKRANRLLRKPKNRERLERLADRLLEVKGMTGEEIDRLFS